MNQKLMRLLRAEKVFLLANCTIVVISLYGNFYCFADKPAGSVYAGSTRTNGGQQQQVRQRATLSAGRGSDFLFRFSPDDRTLATGDGRGPVKLWDIVTGQLKSTLKGTDKQVPKAFSPDGKTLVTGGDKTAKLVDLETGELKATLIGSKGFLTTLFLCKFNSDGSRLITVSDEPKTRLWDAKSGQLIATFEGKYGLMDATFSPGGKLLTTASHGENTVKLWDAGTGRLKTSLIENSESVFGVRFSPDGSIVATQSFDNTVKLWDAKTGNLRATLSGHRGTIYNMQFSPDGESLATASGDGTAILWDVSAGKLLARLPGGDRIEFIEFSFDGRLLATLNGKKRGTVKIWDVQTGQLKATLPQIEFIRFSPSSYLLATANKDGVKLWDAEAGRLKATLSEARFPFEFTRDGRLLATVGRSNTIFLWEVLAD